MISAAFARHLKDMRLTCNRQFQEARLQYPHLDAERFSLFLQTQADALVTAIEQKKPQASRYVAGAAYRHGLHLVGLNWCGPTGVIPILTDAWLRYLPEYLCAFTEQAEDIMIMVAHALHQLSLHAGTRPQHWLQRMQDVIPFCASFSEWKQAGQIIAWQSGLAHFRESALTLANALPEPLSLQAVNAASHQDRTQVIDAFRRNPWWTPASHGPVIFQERLRIGAFTEFGGKFTEPPRIAHSRQQWFVQSGPDIWLLLADAYGGTLHRASANDAGSLSFQAPNDAPVRISSNHLLYDNRMHTIEDVDSISCWDCNETTLALCSTDTFAVILYSLGERR